LAELSSGERVAVDEIAEAMLAQLDDLGARLAQIGAEPSTVLDAAVAAVSEASDVSS
jgi:hypothetical protein